MSNEIITKEIHKAKEIQDSKKTDSRGRINLGTDYKNQEVKVAILKTD